MPMEGLPVLTDWKRTAFDVYRAGYEAWREPIEVRAASQDVLTQPLKPGVLIPTKGISRASIILYGVVYTYKELRNEMLQEEIDDFVRLGRK